MKKLTAISTGHPAYPCIPKGSFLFISLLFTVLMFAGTLQAQTGALTGRVQDEKGKPVGYANVTLLKAADSTFGSGVISGTDGRFSVQAPAAGRYILRFTAIGFGEKKTEAFDVPGPHFSKDFGPVSLQAETKTLQDVSITALRPTIVQKADRMVVSVEGTAMAAGSTAYAVLARSPGVFIDQDGNIQLNGRSGVTVMIDGRLTYLSARDLRTMLEGMSAENIKNIEIITNPSARYDAEGTSGILNINLKKNTQQGINGSVYAGHLYNGHHHGFSAGGNINHKTGPWNSFLNLDAARRIGGREATFTRVFFAPQQTTYFNQVAVGNFYAEGPPSVRAGTDYSFNNRHSIGIMGYFNTNTLHDEFLTDTYIGGDPANPSQLIEANNYVTNTYKNFTSNLHYSGKLDTAGTLLSADLDYARIINRGRADFFNYYTTIGTNNTVQDLLYTNTPNGFHIYSGKIDFTRPLEKGHKLEMGVKASRVLSDNDFQFYFNNGIKVLDPARTSHFQYKESIYAAYLNWSGRLGNKVSAQAGLRAEQTASLGTLYTTGQVTERSYLNLFPSLFVQQTVSADYGINYSYSRRLTRPNYGSLNPFRFYRDPYTWIEGNPFLRPTYTHSFSIAQSFRKVYILTASYQMMKDQMSEIPILMVEDTTTIYTTGNLDDGHSVSLTAVAPFKIMKKWDSQNTALVYYNKFSMMSNNGLLVNERVSLALTSNHTIFLPRDFRLEMNFSYRGPRAQGLYKMASMSRLDLGIKKSFLKKKIDLTINANDVFKTYRFYWTTDINGNVNEFDQYLRWRNVGITLRYNFSKGQKVDDKRRANTLDELNRAN